MSFFDEKKIQGKMRTDRQEERRDRAERLQAEHAYAVFAAAIAPEIEQALAEFPQVAKRLGRPLHKEELHYLHLRRSGWWIGTVGLRAADGVSWQMVELFISSGGALYKRAGYNADEMERIGRRRAVELLTQKLWAQEKEPAPGTYDAKKIAEDYFYQTLGVK